MNEKEYHVRIWSNTSTMHDYLKDHKNGVAVFKSKEEAIKAFEKYSPNKPYKVVEDINTKTYIETDYETYIKELIKIMEAVYDR